MGAQWLRLRNMILIVIFTALCAHAEPTILSVRLINGHSGKPDSHRSIKLYGFNKAFSTIMLSEVASTDANGVAHFKLPLPYPDFINFANVDSCPTVTRFSIAVILANGLNAGSTCSPNKFRWDQVKPQPGELILFTFRRWGAW